MAGAENHQRLQVHFHRVAFLKDFIIGDWQGVVKPGYGAQILT